MKICPQCNTENPSGANNCMNCGASLGEGKLPEELLLRKQLTEANETIAHLNESLAQSKKKIVDASVFSKKIDSLNKEIDNKNTEIGRQKTEIESCKKNNEDLAKRIKKRRSWLGGIIALFAVAVVVIIVMIVRTADLGNDLSRAEFEIYNLNGKLSDLENELSVVTGESTSLYDTLTKYKKLATEKQTQLRKLQKDYPNLSFFVKNIEIANVYRDGTIETNYGGKINASQSMYISPRITVVSYVFPDYLYAKIGVKIYNPDGTLSRGSSSPEGYSYIVDDVPISDDRGDEKNVILRRWGGDDKGHWSAGKYRIELWCDDVCIKDEDFNIY